MLEDSRVRECPVVHSLKWSATGSASTATVLAITGETQHVKVTHLMAFQLKDFVSIVAAMLNRAKATQSRLTDFEVGSVARTLIEAPAIEIEQLYQRMFAGHHGRDSGGDLPGLPVLGRRSRSRRAAR
jgi:hypothetical protein